MPSISLRRYGVLEDAERAARPQTIRPLTYDEVAAPGPAFRDTSAIVPIESVRSGDAQVLAARSQRSSPGHLIGLDVLNGFPSVTSVVATTRVQAHHPLAQVTDLLVFGSTPLPDADTFGNLPGLQRVWLTWAQGQPFDVGILPRGLKALGIARHHLLPAPDGSRFSALQGFTELRQLTVWYCIPKDSVQAIGALTGLEEFQCDAASGWTRLRTCTALESVRAIQPRMSNLRALRSWTRLRRLSLVAGAGLRSLDGLEALAGLERLRLVLVRGHDLSPIRNLTRLEEVSINGFGHPLALDGFGTLPSLRRLTLESPGDGIARVETLLPLAAAHALEALTLRGVTIGDGNLGILAGLPALKRLVIAGDFGEAIDDLRNRRPDIDVTVHGGAAPADERVGIVRVRPPIGESSAWWIRENLASALRVRTNYEAEKLVRRALEREDAALAARVTFDTEADAVCLYATEVDTRTAADVITGLALRTKRA